MRTCPKATARTAIVVDTAFNISLHELDSVLNLARAPTRCAMHLTSSSFPFPPPRTLSLLLAPFPFRRDDVAADAGADFDPIGGGGGRNDDGGAARRDDGVHLRRLPMSGGGRQNRIAPTIRYATGTNCFLCGRMWPLIADSPFYFSTWWSVTSELCIGLTWGLSTQSTIFGSDPFFELGKTTKRNSNEPLGRFMERSLSRTFSLHSRT